MKKLFIIIMCLAMLFGMTGCVSGPIESSDSIQETDVIEEDAVEIPDDDPETDADDSDTVESFEDTEETEADVVDNTAEETPEESKEPSATEFVTDAHTYTFYDEDENGNELDVEYHIPKIIPDTDSAKAINKEIEDIFFGNKDDISYIGFIFTDKYPADAESGYCDISYESYLNQDILSLVIKCELFINGASEYYVYNLDTKTDERLTNADMILRTGLSESAFKGKAKEILGSEFRNEFGVYYDNDSSDPNTQGFFNKQLDNTRSDDNIDDSMLYFNEAGQLCIAARIYSIAGANYYWHDLDTDIYISQS